MDMDVDTKVFDSLRNDLRANRRSLNDASLSMSSAVKSAGQSLEGRQYSLSVQETEASCKIIDASAKNLSILEDYINRLEADVNAYLKCKYNG